MPSATSATGVFTVEVTETLLFAVCRSVSNAAIEAESTSWPAADALTATAMDALEPAPRLARLPRTRLPLVTRFPWDVEAEISETPDGKLFEKVTPVAPPGPALVMT